MQDYQFASHPSVRCDEDGRTRLLGCTSYALYCFCFADVSACSALLTSFLPSACEDLKSLNNLTVTAGWCSAVNDVQKKLISGKLVLDKPALVLSTSADEVLAQSDVDTLSGHLGASDTAASSDQSEKSAAPHDGDDTPLTAPLWSREVALRQIGSTPTEPSAHDVLAAPSAARVNEALLCIERWLSVQYVMRHHRRMLQLVFSAVFFGWVGRCYKKGVLVQVYKTFGFIFEGLFCYGCVSLIL